MWEASPGASLPIRQQKFWEASPGRFPFPSVHPIYLIGCRRSRIDLIGCHFSPPGGCCDRIPHPSVHATPGVSSAGSINPVWLWLDVVRMADGWLVDTMIGWGAPGCRGCDWPSDWLTSEWLWLVVRDGEDSDWISGGGSSLIVTFGCRISQSTRVWFDCVTSLRLHGKIHGHVNTGRVHCVETLTRRSNRYMGTVSNLKIHWKNISLHLNFSTT